jgi:hypothetical protein
MCKSEATVWRPSKSIKDTYFGFCNYHNDMMEDANRISIKHKIMLDTMQEVLFES